MGCSPVKHWEILLFFFCSWLYHRFTPQKCSTCHHVDPGIPALHELSRVVVEERPRLNSDLYDCWPFVFGPIYFEIFLLGKYFVTESMTTQREVTIEIRVLIVGRHLREKSGRISR